MAGLWVAAALIAAGAYTNYEGQQDNLKQQSKIISRANAEEDRLSRDKREKTIAQATEQYDIGARTKDYQDAVNSETQNLMAALESSAPTLDKAEGRVSDDYLKTFAKREADNVGRARTVAQLMGKASAPGELNRRDVRRGSDFDTRLGELAPLFQGNRNVMDSRLRLNDKGSEKQMYGQIMQSVGAAYAGSGAGSGGSGAAAHGDSAMVGNGGGSAMFTV